MGNCFSMQKEHETAIKFFQRALQIDPNFTYAYTLCGHEYFANEDFEKSLMLHRSAIAHDRRHYNAWRAPSLPARTQSWHRIILSLSGRARSALAKKE